MIGAAVGAVFGGSAAYLINSALPGNAAVAQPQAYALVGMAATLASVCSVPLTSVLLLFELTKDYMILLPLMIGPDQIEALYHERNVSALWGKLAAEILMQNWDLALEELNRLKEIIDSKNFSSPLNQLQNRIWLMHWALFIFFNHIR
ncbi:Eukaryotic translation initiation factor 3 subunit E [Zea mays]|uniref:Eukaryotic translation initiation factor 3 subunit E n=1 Tax=Zea mays TaxID=4577 RepID=A0A3L6DZH1_MAIZE|nr:Eukaryotic translation initiation factor 3 subunit E [Zea mays]